MARFSNPREEIMTTHSTAPTRKRTRRLLAGDGAAKALIFAAAFLSFLLSIGLWFSGDRERGLFVGIWVPSICSAGALLLGGRRSE
jgi:hypothetical protein